MFGLGTVLGEAAEAAKEGVLWMRWTEEAKNKFVLRKYDSSLYVPGMVFISYPISEKNGFEIRPRECAIFSLVCYVVHTWYA